MKKKIISICTFLILTLALTINSNKNSMAEANCKNYYGGTIVCCINGGEGCLTGAGEWRGPIIIYEEQD